MMLTIRKEQMRALSAAVEVTPLERVMAEVKRRLTVLGRPMDDQAIRALVEDGMRKSQQYGIGPVHDMVRFIDLMLVWGTGFDDSFETPWARPILTWQAGTGAAKLAMLEEASLAALDRRRP